MIRASAVHRPRPSKTRALAENMAALRSETAARIAPDGTVRDVPLADLEPGDRVLVRPGERVAVDGVVERGASELDQSLVTGETAPVSTSLCRPSPPSHPHSAPQG